MLANHDVIIIFSIHGTFPAIWKQILDAFFMIFIFSLIAIFYLTNAETEVRQLSYYCFGKSYYFWLEMLTFCQKKADFNKIKGVLTL